MNSKHSVGRMTLLGLLCLLLCSCANTEKEAEQLLAQVRAEYQKAKALEPSKEMPDVRDERLRKYEQVVALANTINSRFPDTLVAQGVASGQLDVGGSSLRNLRDNIIPILKRELLAEHDPLTAARLLIDRVSDSSVAADLLVQLARSFDSSGRSREAKAALADAFALALRRKEASIRVKLLSSIAFGHANASRRKESLEVAFAALGAAKQVPTSKDRADALTQIALSYYILGIEERGYEALQSITEKPQRMIAIENVALQLLDKNLPHQILAASTLILDLNQRAQFLLRIASQASQRELSPAVVLLVDQTLPLLTRVRDAFARSTRQIEAARLLRLAGQPERASTTLRDVMGRLSGSDPWMLELTSSIALELAALNQLQDAQKLADRVLEQMKKAFAGTAAQADRERILRTVAQAFASADEPQRALAVTQMIRDPATRVESLCESAELTARAGSTGFARKMLQDAESLIDQDSDLEIQSRLLILVRDSYLATKQVEDAKRIMLRLQKIDRRWRTYLRGFQEALLEQNYINEAISVARSAPEPAVQALLLSEVAKQRYASNNFNEATRLLEEASGLFAEIKDAPRRIALAGLLTDTMLQIQWPQLALQMIEKYKFEDSPIWLCRVASVFAETGQREQALEALGSALRATLSLQRPEDRAQVLLKVGESLALLETALDPESELLLTELLVPA